MHGIFVYYENNYSNNKDDNNDITDDNDSDNDNNIVLFHRVTSIRLKPIFLR